MGANINNGIPTTTEDPNIASRLNDNKNNQNENWVSIVDAAGVEHTSYSGHINTGSNTNIKVKALPNRGNSTRKKIIAITAPGDSNPNNNDIEIIQSAAPLFYQRELPSDGKEITTLLNNAVDSDGFYTIRYKTNIDSPACLHYVSDTDIISNCSEAYVRLYAGGENGESKRCYFKEEIYDETLRDDFDTLINGINLKTANLTSLSFTDDFCAYNSCIIEFRFKFRTSITSDIYLDIDNDGSYELIYKTSTISPTLDPTGTPGSSSSSSTTQTTITPSSNPPTTIGPGTGTTTI